VEKVVFIRLLIKYIDQEDKESLKSS